MTHSTAMMKRPQAQTNLSSVSPASSSRAPSGFSLGRVLGIQVQVDWSLLVMFGLVVFNLALAVLPAWHPDWTRISIWGVAGLTALLFAGSVLANELGHAWIARFYDVPVQRIRLFLFGGVAQLDAEPPSPKSELMMAVVGPALSIALGLLATAVGMQLASGQFIAAPDASDEVTMHHVMAGIGPVATLLLCWGPINLLLGVLNLAPTFPLAGGRLLRSLLWWATGNFAKATRWACAAGRICTWTLISLGALQLASGMLGQGLWLLSIGWFLSSAARSVGAPVTAAAGVAAAGTASHTSAAAA